MPLMGWVGQIAGSDRYSVGRIKGLETGGVIQMGQGNNSIDLRFENYEEVRQHAESTGKTLLILEDYVLDVTSFAVHHPGGAMLLRNNQLKEVSEQMRFHHPLTLTMANSMVIGSFKKDISRIIHPDKALLPQIWTLNHHQYMQVINSPHWLFVPSPRMFDSGFLESFSHNPWWSVPILPSIFCLYIFLTQVPQQAYASTPALSMVSTLLIGYFFFSLAEYLIHRFIFHSESYLPDNAVVRYIHYCAHGIHHMLPNDPDRLVFPPALQVITCALGYFTVARVITFDNPLIMACFWTGFFAGYCTYDICHWSLHHIDTSKHAGSYFHRLQKYHNQHHFGGEEAGFGVSSKLWDVVFRTGFTKKDTASVKGQ